ncbi:DinB family protein [Pedobacter steynii]|uniref:DinB-like domain-containing protein n=1 Tax=Pedobacter steynii TaxID=430522 RepID=A0A1D7QFN4_9SPHI|nr:DinB family protein [Pedobacter steynii]AOM77508.1 hypothetical protein BFS30_10215 [Pedobacter steynii]
MEKKAMLKEMEETMTGWTEVLSSFNQEQLNMVPFEGSWTAGQIAKHLIMANFGFLEVLNGTEGETDRPADQKVARIKSDFLDFTTKMQSPDFILPKAIDYDKGILVSNIEELRGKLTEVILSSDLTKTCLAFEMPVYGYFTRWEAIYFVIYHSQRHLNQLKNIAKN